MCTTCIFLMPGNCMRECLPSCRRPFILHVMLNGIRFVGTLKGQAQSPAAAAAPETLGHFCVVLGVWRLAFGNGDKYGSVAERLCFRLRARCLRYGRV